MSEELWDDDDGAQYGNVGETEWNDNSVPTAIENLDLNQDKKVYGGGENDDYSKAIVYDFDKDVILKSVRGGFSGRKRNDDDGGYHGSSGRDKGGYRGSNKRGAGGRNGYNNENRDEGGNNDYGSNDFGNNDYGNNDYGNNDYGNNDYGNNDYGNNYESYDNQNGCGDDNQGRRGRGRGGSRGGGRGRGGSRGHGRGRGGRYGENGGGRSDGDNEYNENDDNNGDATKPKKEFYIPPEPTNDETEIFNSGIASGINFDKYDSIRVNISGTDIPPEITSFEKSGLREFILKNVEKSGYTKPTPIQKHAIPIIMAKRDLMGCAQTGSGKTAAFLLPIINDLLQNETPISTGMPQALVISPTRELAIQIFNEARKFSLHSFLKIALAYGGPAFKHQGDHITNGCHIVVATPGRLLHFMDSDMLRFDDLRFIVLDEADRMLDMGFLPSIEKVMEHPTMPKVGERQTLMFSATFPDEIQTLAGRFLINYLFLAVGSVGGACTDVDQQFYEVSKYDKRNKLTELLEECGSDAGTIVFVETKRSADFLASVLSETKWPTTSIHGDRLQREREMALNDFRSGKMSVLIATSVAARGLDIKNVKHVINYDLPKSIDDYVHRIGRTGRVGNHGKATSFFDPEQDGPLASDLVRILKQANQKVPDFLVSLSGGDMTGYNAGFSRGKFGGRDVRKNIESFGAIGTEPEPQEPEEMW